MVDDHEAAVRGLFRDVWNRENPDAVDDTVHDEYVIHDRELAENVRGPELYRRLAAETREIFPDMSFEVRDTVSAGERVAVRWTMTGTHEGELFGIEPTGEQVELTAIEINRFEDGKLVETWTESDQLSLMKQINAL